VITHQKLTMECADALYGVSMRGDGISQVISQRLRETPRPAPRRLLAAQRQPEAVEAAGAAEVPGAAEVAEAAGPGA